MLGNDYSNVEMEKGNFEARNGTSKHARRANLGKNMNSIWAAKTLAMQMPTWNFGQNKL